MECLSTSLLWLLLLVILIILISYYYLSLDRRIAHHARRQQTLETEVETLKWGEHHAAHERAETREALQAHIEADDNVVQMQLGDMGYTLQTLTDRMDQLPGQLRDELRAAISNADGR